MRNSSKFAYTKASDKILVANFSHFSRHTLFNFFFFRQAGAQHPVHEGHGTVQRLMTGRVDFEVELFGTDLNEDAGRTGHFMMLRIVIGKEVTEM